MILSQIEKDEIKKRIRLSLLKYLLRDPLFSEHVRPKAEKYCGKVFIPQLVVQYLFSYINYFRIYNYIA